MSDRNKPHNGRDTSGQHKVRRVDLDDLTADPQGETYLRDDVRLGGAVEDVGPTGAEHGRKIGELVERNRDETRME